MNAPVNANDYENVYSVLQSEAPTVDADGRWPEQSLRALQEAGLLGLTLPAEVGGRGAGMRDFASILQRIASSCASTAMIYLMHVCGSQVLISSRFPHREEVLHRIVARGALATLAFSERGSRSHFWAPISRAQQNNGSIVLNCEKSFVTSAGRAEYYIVSSGSIGGQNPTDSTLYLSEKGMPGLEAKGEWNGIGLRGNASAPMVLSNCLVPADNRLTPEGDGFKAMMSVVLPWFQVGSAAVSLGIADAAFSLAVKHASHARMEHLGENLASAFPGVRSRLAQMQLEITSAKAFLDETLAKIESGSETALLSILGVKAVAAETALKVTDLAMRVCGGAAFGRQLPIERNLRDARAASVMAPTTDVLYDFIGKAVAGLPLF